ncbi:MAG: hypothetical protein COT45_01020 [bacterium (Candidatus Stahlbacteria) CG08_land_8_20_14_0_20_40_26]|nr:MAG: hypothetical protein COX49_00930 [bacterium (Candidatus Stahlbacteria) CG23_combo_of_CG06-09_8_20_14_all_40_9]PIS26308.1 MAG: hypothetical protein COT45_01020 [bacterium (Candidatus Stahlbacteria) CG08_land_8_20_14_0_20_40_26]
MDKLKCDKCGREFLFGEKMRICDKCGARLCISCSGGGGYGDYKTVCPICHQSATMREQEYKGW